MKWIVCLAVTISLVTIALASDKQDPLAELDRKITKNLARDKWDDASKAFVRALWEDYRKAYLVLAKGEPTRSIHGKMPDVEKYQDYLGTFGRGTDSKRPFLEITKDETGGFNVKLEKHTIPVVRRNKILVFTTGDVVYSSIPTMSDKPYCTLEMFMIIRTGGKFFMGSPSTPSDEWMQLSKLKKG